MAITYQLVNFVTGAILSDAPVMSGAKWSLALNKPDTLECTISLLDPTIRGMDMLSLTEPRKTALAAVTDDGIIVAWGRIDPKRSFDDTKRQLTLPASGAWSYWDNCIIGPSTARTAAIVATNGKPNTALDVTITNSSFATVGKRLMQQRLTWPGATTMPFVFPDDEVVTGQTQTYPFINYKTIGSALTDLTQRVNGPDFDFTATSDGRQLSYVVRAGTSTAPQLGLYLGVWSAGQRGAELSDLTIDDDFTDFATAVWMSSQGQDSKGNQVTLASRQLNDALIAAGYPPEDFVDTSRSDVSIQRTLDDYASEGLTYASKYQRSFSASAHVFRGDGTQLSPSPLAARPGDFIDLDFDSHPYLGSITIPCRILSMSGDERGDVVKMDLQVVTS